MTTFVVLAIGWLPTERAAAHDLYAVVDWGGVISPEFTVRIVATTNQNWNQMCFIDANLPNSVAQIAAYPGHYVMVRIDYWLFAPGWTDIARVTLRVTGGEQEGPVSTDSGPVSGRLQVERAAPSGPYPVDVFYSVILDVDQSWCNDLTYTARLRFVQP
jgi:hypothetical protein